MDSSVVVKTSDAQVMRIRPQHYTSDNDVPSVLGWVLFALFGDAIALEFRLGELLTRDATAAMLGMTSLRGDR